MYWKPLFSKSSKLKLNTNTYLNPCGQTLHKYMIFSKWPTKRKPQTFQLLTTKIRRLKKKPERTQKLFEGGYPVITGNKSWSFPGKVLGGRGEEWQKTDIFL